MAITGTANEDTLFGTDGNDIMYGFGDDDVLLGGAGADTLRGDFDQGGSSDGQDTASYYFAPSGVRADLEDETANTGEAAGDTYQSIENLTGSSHGDVLAGNNQHNVLYGEGDNDILNGRGGGDHFDGGGGIDIATYADAPTGVHADLRNDGLEVFAVGTGEAAGDSYFLVEGLIGSDFDDILRGHFGPSTLSGGDGDDTLTGDDADDDLNGGSDNDVLEGGDGGDHLVGGTGTDTAIYRSAVRADLGNAGVNTGDAAGDSYNSIENLTGSSSNDTLAGNGGANTISGRAGTDTVSGNDGDDTLLGGADNDTLNGNDDNDTLEGGSGADNLSGGAGVDAASYQNAAGVNGIGVNVFMLNPGNNTGEAAGDTYGSIENLIGSFFADTLSGNTAANTVSGGDGDDLLFGNDENDTLNGNDDNDTLSGGLGADALNGGSGSDTASYAGSAPALVVSLATPGSNRGEAIGDTYSSIENLSGSIFRDILEGNSGRNTISGGFGDDFLSGLGDNDTLIGGLDADQLDGGEGDDTLEGGVGADALNGGSGGIDTASYANASGGLLVSLATPNLNGGEAAGDTFSSIENLAGTAFLDILGGDSGRNTISGADGDDLLFGLEDNDTLIGGLNADLLDGGIGDDTLNGGAGDDTYRVDSTGDEITEAGGMDRVESTVTWSLAVDSTNVENLTLLGSANINGFGSGAGVANVIVGNDGANTLSGFTGNDTLAGRGGADTIEGGGDSDNLQGEGGNDIFLMAFAADHTATERIDGGPDADEIRFSATSGTLVLSALTASIETVRVSSATGVVGATGADLDASALAYGLTLIGDNGQSTIRGTGQSDTLDGKGGVDTLTGLGGDDFYFVDNALDTVVESAGQGANDRVFASVSYALGANVQVEKLTTADNFGTAAIDLTGNGLVNTIFGNAGNNTLDGKGGADALVGLGGDDFYFVDNLLDSVGEGNAEGANDRVFASVSYVLGASAQVEKLTTADNFGTTSINLTGNGFVNIIFGNAGSNTLDGKGGADDLVGLGGDDFYVVDDARDIVSEGASEGANDRVFASVSYALGAGTQVEKLTTADNFGTNPINLTGNELGNTIFGNAGANALNGGLGNDALVGLDDPDTFVFNTALHAVNNVDVIGDFVPTVDKIVLARSIFATIDLGPLVASAFVTGTVAIDSDDRIIYNRANGALIFDPAGTDGGTPVLFATLTPGLALTAADFLVI